MSTITREQAQAVSDLKAGYTLGHADVAILKELARIALASITAEPMGTFRKGPCGYSPSYHEDAVPLYAAPPAPVFNAKPVAWEWFYYKQWNVTNDPERAKDVSDGGVEVSPLYRRAALLQGANDSLTHEGKNHPEDKLGMVNHLGDANEKGNSPVIPDGWVMVPIEPTEDMIVNGFESEPDESFSDEKEWEAYEAMSGCQQAAHRAKLCWEAMIAAAPKLE